MVRKLEPIRSSSEKRMLSRDLVVREFIAESIGNWLMQLLQFRLKMPPPFYAGSESRCTSDKHCRNWPVPIAEKTSSLVIWWRCLVLYSHHLSFTAYICTPHFHWMRMSIFGPTGGSNSVLWPYIALSNTVPRHLYGSGGWCCTVKFGAQTAPWSLSSKY